MALSPSMAPPYPPHKFDAGRAWTLVRTFAPLGSFLLRGYPAQSSKLDTLLYAQNQADSSNRRSDALGHLFNAIGRDWTHLGVAKLYTDIASNGYNLLYLTSRSVGQADTTRNYLNGVVQDGYRLPRGAVIMSPDRTYAALRREVYLRKPEVFKMACLRDIMSLFQPPNQDMATHPRTPFYAGFGNRITDAMSYRSVSIPSTRIFTINSNAEVSMHLLASEQYRTSYVTMRELVDHYFPPTGLLVKEGGEEYTDFNYWRERPLEIDEFSASESGSDYEEDEGVYDPTMGRPSIEESIRSEDEAAERDGKGENLEASFYSRASLEEPLPGFEESMDNSLLLEEEQEDEQSRSMGLEDSGLLETPGELEIEDPSNQLGALDLASEATPHMRAVDDAGLELEQGELRDLARMLGSSARRSTE
jgi:phosphatidate phosphatase LPIN